MKKWQSITIKLIVSAYILFGIANNWSEICDHYAAQSTKIASDRVEVLHTRAQGIYQRVLKTLGELPTPEFVNEKDQDYLIARDSVALAIAKIVLMRDSTESHLQKRFDALITGIREQFVDYCFPQDVYNEQGRQPRYYNMVLGELPHEVMIKSMELVPSEPFDWNNFLLKLLSFYLSVFIPVVLSMLVIRWPKWNIENIADAISVLFFLIFWPLFVWVYKPDNALKRRLNWYLDRYQEKHGKVQGARLVYAYTIALLMAIASFAKPIGATQIVVQPVNIVTMIGTANNEVNFNFDVKLIAQAVQFKWQEFVRRLMELINKTFEILLYWITSLLISPYHLIYWFNLRPVRIKPIEARPTISANAPPVQLVFNSLIKLTKQYGVNNEIDSNININVFINH